jgi:hypothetical protein
LDDLKDYAKRWWALVQHRALSIKDLEAELDRMSKTVKKQRELKVAIRSMAGRKSRMLNTESD